MGTYLLTLPWDLGTVGGVTQVVTGLYDAIQSDARLAPRVLVASWDDQEPVEQVDAEGRLVVRCRIRSPSGRGPAIYSLLRYLAALPRELARIRALAQRYSVEVVNCHYVGSSEFTWVLAKSLGVYRGKVFLSLHGLDIRSLAAARGLRRWPWAWALRHADAVVACSECLAAETIAAFRLPKTQVVTIHNGVDAAQLARIASEASADMPPTEGPSLLNLGTFEHKKGHDLLLKAFRKVVDRHPAARLTIMGRQADSMESTLRLVAELGLADHTSIRTDVPHEQALRALKRADVFVLSSRNEAFSVALLEAGALGKPVVATDVCGVPELIQDGKTGLRVPPEDVDALAGGILRLLDDKEAATEFGLRLRELVQDKFTLEENCRNYLRLAGCRPNDPSSAAGDKLGEAVPTSSSATAQPRAGALPQR